MLWVVLPTRGNFPSDILQGRQTDCRDATFDIQIFHSVILHTNAMAVLLLI